jgi:superfamily II DNA/RNA helicase
MSVTKETLRQVDEHWAVQAIGKTRYERARLLAEYRLVNAAVGKQMTFEFVPKKTDSDELLEQVAAAYEVAAAEGLQAILHPTAENEPLRNQAKAGAFRAFELLRVLTVPTHETARIFHFLHLASVAYCGDRGVDLRRWLREHEKTITVPSAAGVAWDRRVLYRLFDCLLRLYRKNKWDDLDGIREIVAGLREDQKKYEAGLLKPNGKTNEDSHSAAYRLIALYHWAKATELLAVYMLQGDNAAIAANLDQHFEAARLAAESARDLKLEMLLRWLHVAARQMVSASIWYVARAVNSRVTRFVEKVTKTRSLFELLPPQRVAIQEQGLLDQANRAVVVTLPTSGGKTVLAQFRMLQALNQFDADQGWVAYIAPTRALVAQVTRNLRTDFEPLGIHVESLSAAVEIDGFEQTLLSTNDSKESFHILVATPEKLSLVIRNKKVSRPLALVVVDEAHNLQDEDRGLRIELLLATIKQDCPAANFLLLMPQVPNAEELTKWLAPESGKTISIGTSAWLPNERIIGMFGIETDSSTKGGWKLRYETLSTTPKTIQLRGKHQVGGLKPLNLSYSEVSKSLTNATGAIAKVFSERGTSIAIAGKIPNTWTMARHIAKSLPTFKSENEEIKLVQRFLKTEISPDFELISLLDKEVAVHHAGLSEETRTLIERLTEQGHLRVLCATTTLAQGLNFPVSSVFLADRKFPYGKEMPKLAFWNLAGRAGRIAQDSVGVIGIAAGKNPREIMQYVASAHEDLISRLASMLQELDSLTLGDLTAVIERDEWTDFRSYIAHLWNEKQNLEAVLAETEQTLRNTFGYQKLKSSSNQQDKKRADALLEATKAYARKLAEHPQNATLADATGFSPEGVRTALLELRQLERKLRPIDWEPQSLFGAVHRSVLPQLVGVMMKVPQIKKSLEEIGSGGNSKQYIAEIAQAWVTGESIETIAKKYFKSPDEDSTRAITDACRGIYRTLANIGTWGLSALSKMPTSGLDFSSLPEETIRSINNLPAMLYHGVSTETAVVMRINAVPRSIANSLASLWESQTGSEAKPTIRQAREFLRQLPITDWQKAVLKKTDMTGSDYQAVWQRLAGELS